MEGWQLSVLGVDYVYLWYTLCLYKPQAETPPSPLLSYFLETTNIYKRSWNDPRSSKQFFEAATQK